MRRLSSLGFANLARSRRRYALTSLGIVLGVAVLVGVLVANATVTRGLEGLLDDLAGRSDVAVTPASPVDGDFPAKVADDVAALPGVAEVAPSLSFSSAASAPSAPGDVDVAVTGADLAAAERVFSFQFHAGSFFAPGAAEAVVPDTLAADLGVGAGDRVTIATEDGAETLAVTGVVSASDAGLAAQGNIVFTSLQTARRLADTGPVLSRVDVVLSGDADAGDWITEHHATLPPGVAFQDPGLFTDPFRPFLAAVQDVFTAVAGLALFVGGFLIYVTMSSVVSERTRLHGLLRALGASRGQVRRLVLVEAAGVGAVSTLVGVVAGVGASVGLVTLLASAVGIATPALVVPPAALAAGGLLGLATTVAAALVPAGRAARLEPMAAITAAPGPTRGRARAAKVGAAALAGGVGLFAATDQGAWHAAAALLAVTGATLLLPATVPAAARALVPAVRRLGPGLGQLPVLRLSREGTRAGYTTGLVMVVLAVTLAIGAANQALNASMLAQLDRQFGADVQVTSDVALGDATAEELAALPGVESLTAVRVGEGVLHDGQGNEPVTLRVIDPSSYFTVTSFPWVDGDDDVAAEALADGGALLPEAMADRLGLGRGDAVTLTTRDGPARHTVAGTYGSLATGPQVVIGAAAGHASAAGDGAEEFHLRLAEGHDAPATRAAAEAALDGRPGVAVTTAADLRAEGRAEMNRYFAVVYAVLLVAGIVGLVGLANTIMLSVVQRAREIGVLRAVGAQRRQLRRLVVGESALLVALACVAALPLGGLLSRMLVDGVGAALGFSVPRAFPWSWVPVVYAVALGLALAAAAWPARRSTRLDVVDALAAE